MELAELLELIQHIVARRSCRRGRWRRGLLVGLLFLVGSGILLIRPALALTARYPVGHRGGGPGDGSGAGYSS